MRLERRTERNRVERSVVRVANHIGRSRARTAVRVGTFDQVICSPMRIELIATIQDSWIGCRACHRAKPLRYCGTGSDDGGRFAAAPFPHPGLAMLSSEHRSRTRVKALLPHPLTEIKCDPHVVSVLTASRVDPA